MKKNEIALLLVIAGIVGLISYFTVNSIVGGGKPKSVEVEKVEQISSTIDEPNKAVFGSTDAFNPTVKIIIGDQSNQDPF